MRTAPERRARRGLVSGLTGVLVGGIVFAAMTTAGLATLPASAATAGESDDLRPVTISAADYYAQSPYGASAAEGAPLPDLELTVSQTDGLIAQGIEVSWKGGKQSSLPSQQVGGENFLQIAQCWGDDPMNPGTPDRTTCQYGATGTPGGGRNGERGYEQEIPAQDQSYTVRGTDSLNSGETAIPFKSSTVRDGKNETAERIVNGAYVDGRPDINQNQFFSQYTSNEVAWAGSGANGTGSAKFEVQTAVQSRALGCGRQILALDGTPTAQSCWLVIIPRGTSDNGEVSITQSGLFWDSWEHHIAVRLDFRAISGSCTIGAAERQVVGSELLATAVSSWQPSLCANEGDIFNMITGTEADAVTAANLATGSAPLALTSRPYSGEGADDLVYAPVGLSAVTIAFSIDRVPLAGSASEEALGRAGLPFTALKLTPRLVAKLLSYSYVDSVPKPDSDPNDGGRAHLKGNPRNLTYDPEFLAINDPEWKEQGIAGVGVSDMLLPQGRSDVALALWNYVLADDKARAFLNGEPDEWGTKVNKYSSTNAAVNPSGALQLPVDNFPKADPTKVPAVQGGAGELNLITWRAYTNDLDHSGYLALRGDSQIVTNWDAFGSPPRYLRAARSLPGEQSVIALTDSAASSKYQIVTAALQNPAGEFVTASTESMTSAAGAMTPSATQSQVRTFDVASEAARGAAGAYPLTMAVYAAANPYMTDAEARASYATFIRYAAGYGQVPGFEVGQLPVGYAPLPEAWRSQAVAAANVVQGGLKRSAAPAPSGNSPSNTTPRASGVPNSNTATSVGSGSSGGPTAAAPAGAATDPAASGQIAGALAGATTPDDPGAGGLGAVLPVSLIAGLFAAASVLIIPRLPRQS